MDIIYEIRRWNLIITMIIYAKIWRMFYHEHSQSTVGFWIMTGSFNLRVIRNKQIHDGDKNCLHFHSWHRRLKQKMRFPFVRLAKGHPIANCLQSVYQEMFCQRPVFLIWPLEWLDNVSNILPGFMVHRLMECLPQKAVKISDAAGPHLPTPSVRGNLSGCWKDLIYSMLTAFNNCHF